MTSAAPKGHKDQLNHLISDLFNAKCDGTCAPGSINEFLSCANRQHQNRTQQGLMGLDFGDMTFVFTTTKNPNLALIVSYNEAFIEEMKEICSRFNNGKLRANSLAPRVVAEKVFWGSSYDHVSPRKDRKVLMKPSGRALLVTDFARLDLNEIRRAGIEIKHAIAKEQYGDMPLTEGCKAARDNTFYEVLANRLLSAAPSVKAYGRAVAERVLRREPQLVAA